LIEGVGAFRYNFANFALRKRDGITFPFFYIRTPENHHIGRNAQEPPVSKPALLALADGTLFHGTSIGADGETIG